jgi:2-hydroxychromene-2-carboxylate isomerase
MGPQPPPPAEAIERGVFGAPAFFVGDEMFWGNDRLHFVEAALKG